MHAGFPVITPAGTPLPLSAVLDIVHAFVQENRGEIIVLDFHRFLNADPNTPFDYTACQAVILNHPLNTEDRFIPYEDRDKTYGELLDASPTRRVIAAWINSPSNEVVPFWIGVDQIFDAEKITTSLLYQFIAQEFTAPQTALVSAQDAINRADAGPYYWLGGSTSFFSDISRGPNLNIIHSDFVDQATMVETAIAMNLIEN